MEKVRLKIINIILILTVILQGRYYGCLPFTSEVITLQGP